MVSATSKYKALLTTAKQPGSRGGFPKTCTSRGGADASNKIKAKSKTTELSKGGFPCLVHCFLTKSTQLPSLRNGPQGYIMYIAPTTLNWLLPKNNKENQTLLMTRAGLIFRVELLTGDKWFKPLALTKCILK